jgi:hypothetical protein
MFICNIKNTRYRAAFERMMILFIYDTIITLLDFVLHLKGIGEMERKQY